MCGIIARVDASGGVDELLTGLANLEYRGYDSAGIAAQRRGATRPAVVKHDGGIGQLTERIDGSLDGHIAIGHTRWSTHGPPITVNAHPHTDCSGEIAVVHNGIIRNHQSLRRELEAAGHEFESDTDTEVVPHLVERFRDSGLDLESAFRRTVDAIEGSYALALIASGDDAIYAARSGSPLVLGVAEDGHFLASDVPAFLEFTDRVVYLEDGDVAIVTEDDYRVSSVDGTPKDVTPEQVRWESDEVGKGAYEHYMRKEIDEQPTSLRQALDGRLDPARDELVFDDFDPAVLEGFDRVQFVGCGTSYHAAKYATQLAAHRDVPAQTFLANEYATSTPYVDDRTLVVAVTQSGETADTLSALRSAAAAGATTLAVTNVVGSTAARECDHAFFIRAGPEIGVAATKTFSAQVVCLLLLVDELARRWSDDHDALPDRAELFEALAEFPSKLETTLADGSIREVARAYEDAESHFFIGRDTGYTVALEGALKFKEITYEHAEGFAAGELKHGPLALVTPDTPVVGIATGEERELTQHNLSEAQARDAPIISITTDPEALAEVSDHTLAVPETHPELVNLLANVKLQLLSYHAAAMLDRPIDKPRNLAKSVTVE
jgi:glucosamine--fructose-6-phosphate aminotransferase (isomerizing)